jgi:thiol-disulfide isomerase/thioredoxin
MINITNNMDEVQAEELAVAYFTASWCQPCKALKPQYAQAGTKDTKYTYFVIDVDSIDKAYLDLYNIKSVPTILQMDKGKVERRITAKTSTEILDQVNLPL